MTKCKIFPTTSGKSEYLSWSHYALRWELTMIPPAIGMLTKHQKIRIKKFLHKRETGTIFVG